MNGYEADLVQKLLDDAVLKLGSAVDDIRAASNKFCDGRCLLLLAMAGKIESNKAELVKLLKG